MIKKRQPSRVHVRRRGPAPVPLSKRVRRNIRSYWKQGALVTLLLSVSVFWLSGLAAKSISLADAKLTEVVTDAGIVVKEFEVIGLQKTRRDDIINALAIAISTPMHKIDIAAARHQVEALIWVKSASVSRKLPGLVSVEVIERTPFAIWQIKGEMWLIDADGVAITDQNISEYAHLPFLVGEGAPDAAAELYQLLDFEPELAGRVVAAIRVGGRRWDVEFDTGARLKLPEESSTYDALEAWKRFSVLVNQHSLLEREVESFDMRLADRLVIQVTPEGREEIRRLRSGQRT